MTRPLDGRLIIVGAGASGREVAWIAKERFGPSLQMLFAVEPAYFSGANLVDGTEVCCLHKLEPGPGDRFAIAIGDSATRERIDRECSSMGLEPVAIVHPNAVLSPTVSIAPGAIIYPGTVLTANVSIGRHSHVNTGCTLSHDVTVDDFATLSPGVSVAGHVVIRKSAFLGIGATIVNGRPDQPLVIGERAIVLAGACVTRAVEPNTRVAGVPAKTRT